MIKLSAGIVAGVIGLLIGTATAGNAAPAPRPLDRVYHCGEHFHGHTVRGYLVDLKGTPTHLAYVVPAETLLVWRQRGIVAAPCQK